MKLVRLALLAGLMVAIALSGCQTDDDDPITPTPANSLYTNNVKDAPVYLNLETGDSASVWDIAFMAGAMGQYPKFLMNGGVSGSKGYLVHQVATAAPAASHDTTGWSWSTDESDVQLGIGSTWAVYNPINHTIGARDTVSYVLRYDAYSWIKFHVSSYTDTLVSFEYSYSDSISNGNVYWGTVHNGNIAGAVSGTLKYFRFGMGEVTSNTWQFAMVASWVWTGTPPSGIGYAKYPLGRLNKTTGVEASWLNTPFDQVSAVPAGTQWYTDNDTLYSGQIFYYNHLATPRPRLEPWNRTLLVKQSGHVWKVSFDSYYHQTTDASGYVTYRKSMIQ